MKWRHIYTSSSSSLSSFPRSLSPPRAGAAHVIYSSVYLRDVNMCMQREFIFTYADGTSGACDILVAADRNPNIASQSFEIVSHLGYIFGRSFRFVYFKHQRRISKSEYHCSFCKIDESRVLGKRSAIETRKRRNGDEEISVVCFCFGAALPFSQSTRNFMATQQIHCHFGFSFVVYL